MLDIKSFSLLSFCLMYLDVPCRKQDFNCKICTFFYIVVVFWDVL